MNTTENNKIIAEFLGWSKKINKEEEEIPFYNLPIKFRNPNGIKEYIPIEGFIFESDWNWLMEVVEKIESLGGAVCIGNGNCVMIIFYLTDVMGESYSKTRELIGETKIEAVYNACVEFIKWYNENSAKNN